MIRPKKKGYNWKARQSARGNKANIREDTNQLVIIPIEKREDGPTDDIKTKKSKSGKLTSKQKKRLKKVLQAKEQKAKVKCSWS